VLSLEELLNFTRFTHQVRRVERTILAPGSDHLENDAEHSFQLAILALYLNEALGLKLNGERLTQYALLHDVVEVYAGDTFAYGQSETLTGKADREHAAVQKLRTTFPEFTGLSESIEAYEARQDAESKFVYALDKFVPVLNNFLDKGRSWKKHGITLEALQNVKRPKLEQSPDLLPFYEELETILAEKQAELFA